MFNRDRRYKNKFGYCYYIFHTPTFEVYIFNLYVYPKYRRKGNARKILQNVINAIRKKGYKGIIKIEAIPRENSIDFYDLVSFYESLDLHVINMEI